MINKNNDALGVLTESFNTLLKDGFNADLLEGKKFCFQFQFQDSDPLHLIAAPEKFKFCAGVHSHPAINLYVESPEVLLQLLNGTLNGMDAFMDSKYRSDGNIVLSQILLYLFSSNTSVAAVKE